MTTSADLLADLVTRARRAGADAVLTYFAVELAHLLATGDFQ